MWCNPHLIFLTMGKYSYLQIVVDVAELLDNSEVLWLEIWVDNGQCVVIE